MSATAPAGFEAFERFPRRLWGMVGLVPEVVLACRVDAILQRDLGESVVVERAELEEIADDMAGLEASCDDLMGQLRDAQGELATARKVLEGWRAKLWAMGFLPEEF